MENNEIKTELKKIIDEAKEADNQVYADQKVSNMEGSISQTAVYFGVMERIQSLYDKI